MNPFIVVLGLTYFEAVQYLEGDLRSSASATCSDWHSTGSTRLDCTATGQRSFAVNGLATWNRLPPALRSPDRFQAGTEDTPVLNLPSLLRRIHDFGAGSKYPDLLTYLLTYSGTLSESPGLFPYLRSQGVEVVSAVAHQATRQVAVCARRDDLNAANIDGS